MLASSIGKNALWNSDWRLRCGVQGVVEAGCFMDVVLRSALSTLRPNWTLTVTVDGICRGHVMYALGISFELAGCICLKPL